MQIRINPDLRCSNATAFTAEQIPGMVTMVDDLIQMSTTDFSDGKVSMEQPDDVLWYSYMARMMATIQAQQKQIEELKNAD